MKVTPPVKVIRQLCLECMGGSRKRVSECETTDCPAHIYRMGKNPNMQGIGGNSNLKKNKRVEQLREKDK